MAPAACASVRHCGPDASSAVQVAGAHAYDEWVGSQWMGSQWVAARWAGAEGG